MLGYRRFARKMSMFLSAVVIASMMCMTVASSYAEESKLPVEQGDGEQSTDPSDSQEQQDKKEDADQGQSASGQSSSDADQKPAAESGSSSEQKPAASKEDKEDKKDEAADKDDEDKPIAQTLKAETPDCTVKVICEASAGIPKGAELVAKKKKAKDYYDLAAKKVEGDRIDYSLFLDITIVKDGKELEPADKVKVKVSLADLPKDDRGQLEIVHFKETKDDIKAEEVDSKKVDSAYSFKADSFSVYGFLYAVTFETVEPAPYFLQEDEVLVSTLCQRLNVFAGEDPADYLAGSEAEVSSSEILGLTEVPGADEQVADWKLSKLTSFTTEETLTVTLESEGHDDDTIIFRLTDYGDAVQSGPANKYLGDDNKWHISDNVEWHLYNKSSGSGTQTVIVFTCKDPTLPKEQCAITSIYDADGKRIDKNAALRKGIAEAIIGENITGIGWTARWNDDANKVPRFESYPVHQDATGALSDCSNLAKVTVYDPGHIEILGWSAFRRCKALTSFDFSRMSNLRILMTQAFDPTGLTEVDLSACSSLEIIGAEAFCQQDNDATSASQHALKRVSLPAGTADKGLTIGNRAFRYNKALDTVIFADASKVTFAWRDDWHPESRNDTQGAFHSQNENGQATGVRCVIDKATKTKNYTRESLGQLFKKPQYYEKDSDPHPFWFTRLSKTQIPLNIKVLKRTLPYNGRVQYGYEIKESKNTSSDKNGYTVSGLYTEDTVRVDYTPSSGRTRKDAYENGKFNGFVVYEELWGEEYTSTHNYTIARTPGDLCIQEGKDIVVTITGRKTTKTYNGDTQSSVGFTYKVEPDVKYDFNEEFVMVKGSAKASRKNFGTTDMVLRADQFEAIDHSYKSVTFETKKGYIRINAAPVNVMITGHEGTNTYDGREHTTEGFEFTASNPLYKRSDFTYSGKVSATREDFGTTGMDLSPAQFRNINNNFTASFSVSDGHQNIDPTATVVTIIGHTATDHYDGESHTVEGFDFRSSNPLYKRSDFAFTGKASASREEVGSTGMGLSLRQFKNMSPNFNVSFTIIDGSQTIDLAAGRSASLFAANLANHVFPGGGLYLATNDHWGLLNLVFTVIAILIAVWGVLWRNFRDTDKTLLFSPVNELIGVAPALAAVVFFFATETLSLPMKILDQWTFVMAIFVLIEFTIVYMMKVREEDEDIKYIRV